MGSFTAFRCDRTECGTIAEGDKTSSPKGWVTLSTHANGVSQGLNYCSNYCLAVVAVERYEYQSGETWTRSRKKVSSGTKRISTPATVASARRASNINWHKQGKHTTLREECPICFPEAAQMEVTA